MFERFTTGARQAVVTAQESARRLRHDHIGTEHVLLGLTEIEDPTAGLLARAGVTASAVREKVVEILGEGSTEVSGHIPFTKRAKTVLELSLREALRLKQNHIGTEHIVLGLLREGQGLAAQVIAGLGVDTDRLRRQLVDAAAGGGEPAAPEAPPPRTPAAELVVAAAERLAGGSPVGSHHLLEALARAEDSVAARALTALGVDPEALVAKLDELGLEGSSDLTEEESAARQMEIRMAGDAAEVVLRDPDTVELARSVLALTGGPIRGDDPLAGGLVELHQHITAYLRGLRARLEPPAASGAEPADPVSRLTRWATRSRLRRRGRDPGPE